MPVKYIILLLTILILTLKIFSTVRGYSFIAYGTDSPRILAEIQQAIGQDALPPYISPRLYLTFVGLFEQLDLEIAPQDALLPVVISANYLSVVIIILISHIVFKDNSKAILAGLIYVLGLVIVRGTSSTLYTLVFGPLLILLFLRFTYFRASALPMTIIYLGSYVVYSALLLVTNGLLTLFLFFRILQLAQERNVPEIKRLSVFFLLFPVCAFSFFPMDNSVVQDSYKGIFLYFSRSFGLWNSVEVSPILFMIIFSAQILSILLGLSLIINPNLLLHIIDKAKGSLTVLKQATLSLNIELPKRIFLSILAVLGLVFLFDLSNFLSAKETYNSSGQISFQLFGRFFGEEFWRDIFLPFEAIYLMAIPGVFLLQSKVRLLALIFFIIPLLAAQLSGLDVFSLLANERGFRFVYPFAAILATASILALSPFKSIQVTLLTIVFLLGFSVSSESPDKPNQFLLQAADWYRQQIANKSILVLSPNIIPVYYTTERAYSLSFLPSRVTPMRQSELNWQIARSCFLPKSVGNQLKSEGIAYIFSEPWVDPEINRMIENNWQVTKKYDRSGIKIYQLK